MKVYSCIAEEYSSMRGMNTDIRRMCSILDESMDVSFCTNTIHVVPDWRKVISEMVRIVRQRGILF